MTKNYEEFKTYLKKIGSGEFTGKSLTREETKAAIKLMLKEDCLLYTSPSPRDRQKSRMPSSA